MKFTKEYYGVKHLDVRHSLLQFTITRYSDTFIIATVILKRTFGTFRSITTDDMQKAEEFILKQYEQFREIDYEKNVTS